jgi:Flp pilus assembly protein TadD
VRRVKLFLLLITFITAACSPWEASRKKAYYHSQMGESMLREGNITSALVEFTKAEQITPDDPDLLYYLGVTYYRKGRYDIAEKKYLQALELRPTFSSARNHLGVNYMEMQRWDDAINQLRQVTDDLFYQDQESAHVNLGLAYLGKGDYQKAMQVMRATVNNYPKNPTARVTMGRVYFALEKTELAIVEYRRALDLAKDYVYAHYYLGLSYMKTKMADIARAEFLEVIRLAPDSELGRQSREYLDLLK